MPINSKQKGNRAERELSSELRKIGFTSAKRGQQYQGSPDSPDVVGVEGFHIECKHVERLNIYDAVDQAVKDAGSFVPVVMHRKNRKPWLITLKLEDLLAAASNFQKALNNAK